MSDRKTALITGVTGQDGAYLAHHLLGQGYRVIGSSRNASDCNRSRLSALGIDAEVEMVSLDIEDESSVDSVMAACNPGEVYHLAGQTSVGASFEKPRECVRSIILGTLNLLESQRRSQGSFRLFNAGSTECFGEAGSEPASEQTPPNPQSPYAAAKASALLLTQTYRRCYALYSCTGILANHESTLRPDHFVTQKIIQGVKAIRDKQKSTLELGNLDVWRDWGWAPDYVRAMHLMLQADEADDYIIASGQSSSLAEFTQAAFELAGVSMANSLKINERFKRASDIQRTTVCPGRIENRLGWSSRRPIREIATKMLAGDLF